MRQPGCTPPMTSPATSCSKLLNRKLKKGEEQLPHSILEVFRKCTFILTSIMFSMRRHIIIIILLFHSLCVVSMGSGATSVVLWREGIHGTGLIHILCIHIHTTHIHKSQGEGEGDKDYSGVLRKEESLRGKNEEEEEYSLEFWDELGSLRRVCVCILDLLSLMQRRDL